MASISPDYFPFLLFGAFVLAVFLWVEWERRIRVMQIPGIEIKRMADDMIAEYGERAEGMAVIEEDRAWRYSQNFEQGKWRRVRREIVRQRGSASGC